MTSKINFKKALFLSDDSDRDVSFYVTEIIFKDSKSILANAKIVLNNPSENEYLGKETIRFHINRENNEATSDKYSFYRLSNYQSFLKLSLKNPCFKSPKMPKDSIKLPRQRVKVHE